MQLALARKSTEVWKKRAKCLEQRLGYVQLLLENQLRFAEKIESQRLIEMTSKLLEVLSCT